MKDQNFSIKISDLLIQTGKIDEVLFEKKFSSQLLNLTSEGISGTFIVQSLNDTSLLGTLKDVKCKINDVCDSCQEAFFREVNVPEYTAKFILGEKDEKDEKDEYEKELEDEVFFIDPKNETIDIHDMVVQAIVLQEPIVKRCRSCEKRLENEGDEDEISSFESSGNITFS